MKGLLKNERCPLHKRRDCCGRQAVKDRPRRNPISGPVTRITDPTWPLGFIEVCSPAERRRRKHILIGRQDGKCAGCGEDFTDVRETELDHILPAPAGCKKNSHWSNIQVLCHECNSKKGSSRNWKGA